MTRQKRPTKPQILDEIARATLGIDDLTRPQEEAISAILRRQDTMAILPTGAGKSAIYQIAGCLLPGGTVVISPLIALQHDQVHSLAELAVGGAVAVNSTKGEQIRIATLEQLQQDNKDDRRLTTDD